MDKLSRLIGKKTIRKKKIHSPKIIHHASVTNSDPILTVDYHAAPPLIAYREIPRQKFENVEEFDHYLRTSGSPVVVKTDSDWPATNLWSDPNYFKQDYAESYIPIGNRKNFTVKNYASRMVTFQQYVNKYLHKSGQTKPQDQYRLSQYLLFDQFPKLKNDIIIPDQVDHLSSFGGVHEIQAWIEPHYSVTPLQQYQFPPNIFNPKKHLGPYNCFTQVVGAKYYRIYSNSEALRIYVNDDPFLKGTSQVDVERPNLDIHPLFHSAAYQERILFAGDMLFVPANYFVYMKSLSYSCSVNFKFVKEKIK